MSEETVKNVKTIKAVPVYPIPEYTGLNVNGVEYEVPQNWEGHTIASAVGRVWEDGKVESFFVNDKEEGTTATFDKLKEDMPLLMKNYNMRDPETRNLVSVMYYYIPYNIEGHCSTMPTFKDYCMTVASNAEYSIMWEVLLVSAEGLMRYITFDYKTAGYYSSTFFDQVKNLEDMFEELFENGERGFTKTTEYGVRELVVEFYDENGSVSPVEILSISELLSMVASLRVIKIETKITN